MSCGLCGARKARRACPALGRDICPTCCGTKRQVEISCPSSCGWLHSAQVHPPAAVQRQQAADQRLLHPLLDGLDQATYVALTVCLEAASAFRASAVPSPNDEDLQEAAAALAATRETAARGVIYEHRPASLVAGRLAGLLRDALEAQRQSNVPLREDETIAALRRIERVVRGVRQQSAAPTAFLDFLARVLRPGGHDPAAADRLAVEALAGLADDDSRPQSSRLIVP